MLSSLRGRLLISLLPPLTILLACGCGWLYWYQKEMMQRDFDRTLGRRAFNFLRHLPRHLEKDAKIDLPTSLLLAGSWNMETKKKDWVVTEGITPPSGPIAPAPKDNKPSYSTVILPDGKQVRVISMWAPPRRRGRAPKRPDEKPTSRPADLGNRDSNTLDKETPAEQHTPSSQPLASKEEPFSPPPPPRHIVQIATDMAPMRAALGNWLLNLLFMAGSGEVLVIVVVLLAVRRGLKPLRPLATDIASISDTNLARRVGTKKIPREIQPVVRQLNAMLERLEAAFIREQSFIANAAHELRTPLAGIRTQLEVSLRRERPAAESRQIIKEILTEAKSLQCMLDILLTLSRLDAGQVQPIAEPVDVSHILQECWRNVAYRAEERSVRVNWQLHEQLTLEIDGVLLERIASNLLSNAAEYADPTEPILVATDQQDQILSIRVSNAAPGLTDKDVECMFDRFWRKDEAHSAVGHHAGLGLSLVKQCVRALAGQVVVVLNDGYLSITVTIPSS